MSLKVVNSYLIIDGCQLVKAFSYKIISLKVVSSSLTVGDCRLVKGVLL